MKTKYEKVNCILASFVISTLMIGCTMPGEGVALNETAREQANTAVAIIENGSLQNADNTSVFESSDSIIVLGEPFTIAKKTALPPVFLVDSEFRKMEAQSLDGVTEYLNQKFSKYGLSFGFTSDAVAHLEKSASASSDSSSSASSDDSAGVDIEQILGGASSTTGLASTSSITMNLNLGKTNLKRFLDSISSRTNLWWRYNAGKVSFYRTDTRVIPLNDFALDTTLTSTINTSNSGGSGEGLSGNSSSSHSYTMTHNIGNSHEQLETALATIASPDEGSFAISKALSIVTMTDTPERLDIAEKYIKKVNAIAGRQITMEIEIWELITTDTTGYGVEGNLSYNKGKISIGGQGLTNSENSTWGQITGGITEGAFSGTEVSLQALQTTKSLSLRKRTTTTAYHNGVTPIQFVRERAYAKDISNTIDNGQSQASLTTDTTVNGVVLFAAPKVNTNGTVGVTIISDLSALNSLETFNVGEDATVQQPDRTVSSLVSSRNIVNGDTAIMTGFEQDVDTGSNNSIFGQKLWALGGNDSSEKARSILLIIVTPYLQDV